MKYKYLLYVSLLTIISCNQPDQRNSVTPKRSVTLASVNNQVGKEISWKGFLNGKTPVFIHYQLDGNIIVGEITYLNTKNKLPITLLGTIDSDNNYRILEFEKSGNITVSLPENQQKTFLKEAGFHQKPERSLHSIL